MLAAAQPAAPFNGPAMFASPASLPPPAGRFAANPAAPTGLLVPLTIPTQAGDVSAYLQLGPDAAANPQAVIAHLAAQGWPIRSYDRARGYGQSGQRFGRSWR